MTDSTHAGAGPSHRAVECGVAIAMIAFGGLVIFGSLKVGIGWGAEGPKAGFFPFYLGVAIILASVMNLIAATTQDPHKVFAEWSQLEGRAGYRRDPFGAWVRAVRQHDAECRLQFGQPGDELTTRGVEPLGIVDEQDGTTVLAAAVQPGAKCVGGFLQRPFRCDIRWEKLGKRLNSGQRCKARHRRFVRSVRTDMRRERCERHLDGMARRAGELSDKPCEGVQRRRRVPRRTGAVEDVSCRFRAVDELVQQPSLAHSRQLGQYPTLLSE